MKKILPLIFALFFIIPSITLAATFNHNLSYGVTTTDVSQLQQFLADEGLYNGPITATFGTLTKDALIAFQQKEGISASGLFGPVTRAQANAIVAANPEWITTVSNNNTYKNSNGNVVSTPTHSAQPVAGATAQCKDGTYSFSLHHSGTCSGHEGVASWL